MMKKKDDLAKCMTKLIPSSKEILDRLELMRFWYNKVNVVWQRLFQ